MARPLRIEFEGAVYHVTSRGDRREPIFEDDEDRLALLRVIAAGLDRFDASLLAWCLMGNHYHLVLRTRRANLSRVMRHVNGVYTQAYNRRHGKVGHLFQGRFKAILVDEEAYLLQVCRYVDLNPVRAGLVPDPADWPWSSYRALAGLEDGPAWLERETLYGSLGARTPAAGAARYAAFVHGGRDDRLWEHALRGQIYLGGEAFAARMQAALGAEPRADVPRVQRHPQRLALERYFAEPARRAAAIARACREGGYTLTEVARHLGLSVSRVSRLRAAFEAGGTE